MPHSKGPVESRRCLKLKDVKRWDGHARSSSNWDGLRRDAELWSESGDCLVHLYGKGSSRRGPSFKIDFDLVKASSCGPLFTRFFAQMSWGSPRQSVASAENSPDDECSSSAASDSGYSSTCSLDSKFSIFIAVPDGASRDDSFSWHLTTRNFFAWLFDKPLAGNTLGQSLVDLLDRMVLFRSEKVDNVGELLAYAERMGYLHFAHAPDYALAFLHFAEHFQLRDLWLEAFAHCVGMNDDLYLSDEFPAISRVTKALITRAYLEMDLHIGRVTRSLSNLLEDELSPANLGLPDGARIHLDRFRSFLHSFYVAKFGYWPPPEGPVFGKSLLHSMYQEFNNLYDYLVDSESVDSAHVPNRLASGGICVLQNVDVFNKKHSYDPLPHPLPLLPQHTSIDYRTQSQRSLRALKLGTKAYKSEKCLSMRAALLAATNTVGPQVMTCALVEEYITFEQGWVARPDEKVSLSDARKVRWIAIYYTLQMLISVTKVPPEVRDPDTPSYPLCCLVAGTPPWEFERKSPPTPQLASAQQPRTSPSTKDGDRAFGFDRSNSPMSIHPDCEDDDYFSQPTQHRASLPLAPAPLRIARVNSAPVQRSVSMRTRNIITNFSRRNTILKSSTSSQSLPYHESPTYSHRNSLIPTVEEPCLEDEGSDVSSLHQPSPHTGSLLVPFDSEPEARTPVLEPFLQFELPDELDLATSSNSAFDFNLSLSPSFQPTQATVTEESPSTASAPPSLISAPTTPARHSTDASSLASSTRSSISSRTPHESSQLHPATDLQDFSSSSASRQTSRSSHATRSLSGFGTPTSARSSSITHVPHASPLSSNPRNSTSPWTPATTVSPFSAADHGQSRQLSSPCPPSLGYDFDTPSRAPRQRPSAAAARWNDPSWQRGFETGGGVGNTEMGQMGAVVTPATKRKFVLPGAATGEENVRIRDFGAADGFWLADGEESRDGWYEGPGGNERRDGDELFGSCAGVLDIHSALTMLPLRAEA